MATHIHAIHTDNDIPTYTFNTYEYRQYLEIQTYLRIQVMPTHTSNTYIYCHTYIYHEYLHIHAIPTDTVITAHTFNTYMIPAYIGQYPDIPENTFEIHAHTCLYLPPELEKAISLQPMTGIRLR
jgi:hypothetical protein